MMLHENRMRVASLLCSDFIIELCPTSLAALYGVQINHCWMHYSRPTAVRGGGGVGGGGKGNIDIPH